MSLKCYRRGVLFVVLVAVCGPLPVPSADAQPGPLYVPCIDTMAINSESVFVGKIVALCSPAHCSGENDVIVSVERWLKDGGDDGATNQVQAQINVSKEVLADWKTRGSRLLIFGNSLSDESTGIEGPKNAIALSDPDLRILTDQMEVLKTPETILQAAQGAIDRHPGVYRVSTFTRDLSPETAHRLNVRDWNVATVVPADADLERWALSALDSKQNMERAEAANALGNFPSASNAALLKGLLADAALSNNGSGSTNVYFVRQAAYYSLIRMGVKVPEPMLRKEATHP